MEIIILEIYLLFFFIGLVFGSFLNVLILRTHSGESIVFPASHCPKCGYVLKWYDNIPILSYLLLRAKCRKCKLPISKIYPITESIIGILFLFIGFMFKLEEFRYENILAAFFSALILSFVVFFIEYFIMYKEINRKAVIFFIALVIVLFLLSALLHLNFSIRKLF